MKKLLIFLFICGFATNIYAQPMFATDGGSMSLGGNISLSSSGGDLYTDSENNRSFNVSINPDFSIFIVPSLSIGMEFLARFYSQGSYSSNSLGLGPSLTYYIAGHKDRRVYPYIGASYQFYKYAYKDTDTDYESDSKQTSITGRFGVMFMLSSAVGLTMEGNYTTVTSTQGENDPVKGNQFYFGLGIKSFIF